MAEFQPDQDKPDYHPESFNWKAMVIIIIGVVLLIAAVIGLVYVFGGASGTPPATTTLHGAGPCGICH